MEGVQEAGEERAEGGEIEKNCITVCNILQLKKQKKAGTGS